MKTTLLISLFFLLFHSGALAQQPARKGVVIKNFGPDSLHIPMNAEYNIIDENCAHLIRQTKLKRESNTFYGDFVDVSTSNSELILAKGTHTPEGLLTGPFFNKYDNGNLRAEGNFKQNEFTGTWKLYYEKGTPKLTFNAIDGEIFIIEAWAENGTKLVSEGNGDYILEFKLISWSGELLNGKPEGTWRAISPANRTAPPIFVEKFKDGKFKKGTGPRGPYTDKTRIIWFDESEFPFMNADKMMIARHPCGVDSKRKLITGASYRHGLGAYNNEIKSYADGFLKNVKLDKLNNDLFITGEVSEEGKLINLTYTNAFDESIAAGITRALGKLPSLNPALVDGKPVKQKFEITFKFHSGSYRFDYNFIPINVSNM